jgi:ribosomal protein L7/L12
MSTPDPEDQADRIKAALFAGRKIEAIKLYREQTGVGLAGAKAAIERLEEELRAATPASFANPPGKGCAGASAVLVGIVGAAFWLLLRR